MLVVTLIVGQQALSPMYDPSHARDGYELGLALRRVSSPGDLVVTMTSDLGDPVAIYYSHRRGWIFPPADPLSWWNRLPPDDDESIRRFEELRVSGARWLGFMRRFDTESWEGHERLLGHFDETCEYMTEGSGWLLYRILSPDELRTRPRP